MNTLDLKGIDGTNPLGFLAAMGSFRVAALSDPAAKMGWHLDDATPWPQISTDLSETHFTEAVCTEAKRLVTTVANLGDIIKSASATYRTAAMACIPEKGKPGMLSDADYFSAFASDAVTEDKEGKVTPSLLSFSNGGSGQNLLKDFRMLAARCSPEEVRDAVLRNIHACQPLTNLNWDPSALRSYALRWRDPEKDGKETCIPLHVLAFIGLAAFTSAPSGHRLATSGFDRHGKEWTWSWSLWLGDISYAVASSLLKAGNNGPIGAAIRRYQCRRQTINKRYYFSPATPV